MCPRPPRSYRCCCDCYMAGATHAGRLRPRKLRCNFARRRSFSVAARATDLRTVSIVVCPRLTRTSLCCQVLPGVCDAVGMWICAAHGHQERMCREMLDDTVPACAVERWPSCRDRDCGPRASPRITCAVTRCKLARRACAVARWPSAQLLTYVMPQIP